MVSYMSMPQFKATIGSVDYINDRVLSTEIVRRENAFDTASLTLVENNSDLYPTITTGSTVEFLVKDQSETTYTALLKGIVRFPVLLHGKNESLLLKCDGAGYGLADMVVAQEYGTQSSNPTLDTLQEILVDPTNGIIPAWVNHYLGSANDSGFNYTTDHVEDVMVAVIPHLSFPYKPANKCIDDICDFLTAQQAGNAGPHWIVTTDNQFLLKSIGNSLAHWDKYYGASQAASTLTQGIDFLEENFEPMGPEKNVIIYYGAWRRPSNGDAWTEAQATSWGSSEGHLTVSDTDTKQIVGSKSLKINQDDGVTHKDLVAYYPTTVNAAWDFTSFGEFQIPTLNFYLLRSAAMTDFQVFLSTQGVGGGTVTQDLTVDEDDKWFHFSLPVGPQFVTYVWGGTAGKWSVGAGTINWAKIDDVYFVCNDAEHDEYICIDGLHFGGASVCRVARDQWPAEGGTLGQSTNTVKIKPITDDIGKDDSLKATDDSGFMAQMAYAELLRLRKTVITGTVTIPLIKDALPGQWFHIHAKTKADGTFAIDKDMRATKITHVIQPPPAGYTSTLELTDDLTNSHARARYEDTNKVWAAIRPEWQDRQASSMKAGNLDIRVTRLEKAYA